MEACGSTVDPSTRYLIKSDLLVVPVLDVEQQHHAAVLVSAGQDARVSGLYGAADGLGGQVLKQLRVIPPKTHVPWGKTHRDTLNTSGDKT